MSLRKKYRELLRKWLPGGEVPNAEEMAQRHWHILKDDMLSVEEPYAVRMERVCIVLKMFPDFIYTTTHPEGDIKLSIVRISKHIFDATNGDTFYTNITISDYMAFDAPDYAVRCGGPYDNLFVQSEASGKWAVAGDLLEIAQEQVPERRGHYRHCPWEEACTMPLRFRKFVILVANAKGGNIHGDFLNCAAEGCSKHAYRQCSRCQLEYYCSAECQRKHRKQHKAACKKV